MRIIKWNQMIRLFIVFFLVNYFILNKYIKIIIIIDMDLFESNSKSKHKTEYFVSLQTNAAKSKQIKSDWKLLGIYLFIFFFLFFIIRIQLK